jgi:hypothetical protein
MEFRPKTVGEYLGSKEGAVKLNYSEMRKAMLKCDMEKLEKGRNASCKLIFKELGIDIIENE